MNEKIIDLNLKEKYVILKSKPKKKIPIADGNITMDLRKGILKIQYVRKT